MVDIASMKISKLTKLYDGGPLSPNWAHDSRRITYTIVGSSAPGDIYIYNLADESSTGPIGRGWEAVWAPEEELLAIFGPNPDTINDGIDDELWQVVLLYLDTGRTKVIYELLSPHMDYGGLVWSPDGKQIVLSVGPRGILDPPLSYELYIIDIDSSSAPVRITTTPDLERDPSWSPDGTMIAYINFTTGHFLCD